MMYTIWMSAIAYKKYLHNDSGIQTRLYETQKAGNEQNGLILTLQP